jgi:hypothetical protein
MKLLLATLLLLFSTGSFAKQGDCNGFGIACTDNSINQHQSANALSGSLSHSNAKAGSESSSKSKSLSGSLSGSDSNSGGNNTTVIDEYEAVSASAASLNLAYCSDGASGQAEEGGFSIGQVNYVCEAMASLKISLLLVDMEIAAHESTGVDVHLIRANEYMSDSREIMMDVVSYIKSRRNTAGISATSKDLTWPVGLLALLFFLL